MLGVASAPGGAGASNSPDTLARRALPGIAHGARPPTLLAAAHARLYFSTGTSWSLVHEGVAALTSSYARPGTDLAIHLFENTRQVWTQRLYKGLEYKQDRALFHSFEGDDAVVGIAFANKAEALAFAHAVLALPLEEEVEEKPKWGVPPMAAPVAVPVAINGFAVGGGGASADAARTSALAGKDTGKDKKKAKKEKKSKKSKSSSSARDDLKAKISTPFDFRHTAGMKLADDGRFEISNLKPEWLAAIHQAGISDDMLRDEQTRETVLQALKDAEHAVHEERKSLKRQKKAESVASFPTHAPPPPPVPAMPAPAVVVHPPNHAPPPPPPPPSNAYGSSPAARLSPRPPAWTPPSPARSPPPPVHAPPPPPPAGIARTPTPSHPPPPPPMARAGHRPRDTLRRRHHRLVASASSTAARRRGPPPPPPKRRPVEAHWAASPA
ncbi:hypothetical protein AMAG_03930 [Allomyces macrogynus ATCC 38327]|uniref:WH1 domain-containing protein n=1 Tax=Allomyces macrogynus (strain ATCC 38327) TaxID=578462 RepID=A0A0L0S7E4_ALLM3|nr:hypothetical protein AMAG_03930 [Allomyces macrogynus ATCC 38327]|eukprot:KNE58346.1 hypothetical protein AMAG_03930 [Allomyces macrogynus ATCC 38327]